MKCIGGPCDGQHVRLQPQQRHYDVPIMAPARDIRLHDFNAAIPATFTVTRHTYTVRRFHCDGFRIEFLAPAEKSDLEVFRELLV